MENSVLCLWFRGKGKHKLLPIERRGYIIDDILSHRYKWLDLSKSQWFNYYSKHFDTVEVKKIQKPNSNSKKVYSYFNNDNNAYAVEKC